LKTILEEVNVKEQMLPRAQNLPSPEAKLRMNKPRKSTNKAACNYAIPRSSGPRTLRRDLKIFPYKISVLHILSSGKDNGS
jgi:hypothetical protein